jgi:hypothetical protein
LQACADIFLFILLVCSDTSNEVSQGLFKHAELVKEAAIADRGLNGWLHPFRTPHPSCCNHQSRGHRDCKTQSSLLLS